MFINNKINSSQEIMNNQSDEIYQNNQQLSSNKQLSSNHEILNSEDIIIYKDIDTNIYKDINTKLYKDIDTTTIKEEFVSIKEKNTKVYFVIQCCQCNDKNTFFKRCKFFICCFWCPCYAKIEDI